MLFNIIYIIRSYYYGLMGQIQPTRNVMAPD